MRVELDITLRKDDGTLAAGATASIVQRGTSTTISTYAAATGGSPVSQPITADAEGRIAGWVDPSPLTTSVDVRYTVDGTLYTREVELPSAVPEGWITPTYLGTWVSYGAGFADAQYRRTSEGIVVLRGLIKSGTIGTSAFTLPVGYRPAFNTLFLSATSTGTGRLEVTSAGSVIPTNGSDVWFSLDNTVFRIG